LADYLKQRENVPLNQRHQRPHCVDSID
jgi:hypothetical protein